MLGLVFFGGGGGGGDNKKMKVPTGNQPFRRQTALYARPVAGQVQNALQAA